MKNFFFFENSVTSIVNFFNINFLIFKIWANLITFCVLNFFFYQSLEQFIKRYLKTFFFKIIKNKFNIGLTNNINKFADCFSNEKIKSVKTKKNTIYRFVFFFEIFMFDYSFVEVYCIIFIFFSGFVNLLFSKKPFDAIFSFFVFLFSTLFLFFYLGSDYIGAVHLIVYPGAILIFFVFVTLTIEQKWESTFSFYLNNSNDKFFSTFSKVPNSVNESSILWIGFFTIFFIFFYKQITIFRRGYTTKFPIEDDTFCPELIVEDNFNYIIGIGQKIFSQFFMEINILAIFLFFALVVSIRFLSYNNFDLHKKYTYIFSKRCLKTYSINR